MYSLYSDILLALWFFLPAGIANVVPIFASRISWLQRFDAPIDGGLTLRGRRIFGPHKTWRGIVCGVIAAILTLALQQWLVGRFGWAAWVAGSIDYAALPTVLVGLLFGLGALGGDAVESFFKRQFNIAPGHGWFPFDQIDYIIGGALATALFVRLELRQYVLLIVLWLAVHVIASYIGYRLKLKPRPI